MSLLRNSRGVERGCLDVSQEFQWIANVVFVRAHDNLLSACSPELGLLRLVGILVIEHLDNTTHGGQGVIFGHDYFRGPSVLLAGVGSLKADLDQKGHEAPLPDCVRIGNYPYH